MIRMDRIRKYMIVGLTVLSLAAMTACGLKKESAGNNNATGNIEQSTESATVAKAKDIQMQVKDADGNTVTLTGEATINEAGEMVFEGKDSDGNVVKVTGTAEKTEDGGFKVKEAAVEGTAKVVADNGQEIDVKNSCDITFDEIKNTTIELVTNDTVGNKHETNNAGQNESASDVSNTKPSGENNSANSGELSVLDDKPDNGNNSNASDTTPATPEHTHTWTPVTTTIYHEATGHYEDVVVGTRTVVDKEAWDEPVYEWQYTKTRCKGCGQIFDTGDEWDAHATYQEDVLDDWSHGSYEVIAEKVQVDTIHHEAETHEEDIKEKRWVEDTAAYDETVITGYTCSCGATK